MFWNRSEFSCHRLHYPLEMRFSNVSGIPFPKANAIRVVEMESDRPSLEILMANETFCCQRCENGFCCETWTSIRVESVLVGNGYGSLSDSSCESGSGDDHDCENGCESDCWIENVSVQLASRRSS